MTLDVPNLVTGTSTQAAWLNRLRAAVMTCFLRQAPGYRVKRTTHGTFLELDTVGGGSSGSSIAMYMVTAMFNDYVRAKKWDGTRSASNFPVLDSNLVDIAKHRTHRMSVTREIIDGVTVNYSYSDSNNRFATDGTNGEAQVSYPRYKEYDSSSTLVYPGSVVFATSFAIQDVSGTSGNPITLQEITPARVWARRFFQ